MENLSIPSQAPSKSARSRRFAWLIGALLAAVVIAALLVQRAFSEERMYRELPIPVLPGSVASKLSASVLAAQVQQPDISVVYAPETFLPTDGRVVDGDHLIVEILAGTTNVLDTIFSGINSGNNGIKGWAYIYDSPRGQRERASAIAGDAPEATFPKANFVLFGLERTQADGTPGPFVTQGYHNPSKLLNATSTVPAVAYVQFEPGKIVTIDSNDSEVGSGQLPNGDGLNDSMEAALGTNPTDHDSDNDGVLDGAEILAGNNPLVPDGPDGDQDSVFDAIDNCPTVANNDQTNTDLANDGGDACDTDDDNDGDLDTADNCPLIMNEDQIDTDGDAAGNDCDPDNDNDGVLDNYPDNCWAVPNPGQTNSDTDSEGDVCDTDDDNDGDLDGADNFPVVSNPDQANADGDSLGTACDLDFVPDADNDGDPDTIDNCPAIANPNQEDADQDLQGDACDADDDND